MRRRQKVRQDEIRWERRRAGERRREEVRQDAKVAEGEARRDKVGEGERR